MTASERPGPSLKLRELLPTAGTVSVGEVISSLNLVGSAGPLRPYTIVNFVASADGRVAFQGRSGALGSPADRAVFHGLREDKKPKAVTREQARHDAPVDKPARPAKTESPTAPQTGQTVTLTIH